MALKKGYVAGVKLRAGRTRQCEEAEGRVRREDKLDISRKIMVDRTKAELNWTVLCHIDCWCGERRPRWPRLMPK